MVTLTRFVGWGEVSLGSSRAAAVDFDDVFGDVDELVDQPLTVHFGQDPSLVVIPVTTEKYY